MSGGGVVHHAEGLARGQAVAGEEAARTGEGGGARHLAASRQGVRICALALAVGGGGGHGRHYTRRGGGEERGGGDGDAGRAEWGRSAALHTAAVRVAQVLRGYDGGMSAGARHVAPLHIARAAARFDAVRKRARFYSRAARAARCKRRRAWFEFLKRVWRAATVQAGWLAGDSVLLGDWAITRGCAIALGSRGASLRKRAAARRAAMQIDRERAQLWGGRGGTRARERSAQAAKRRGSEKSTRRAAADEHRRLMRRRAQQHARQRARSAATHAPPARGAVPRAQLSSARANGARNAVSMLFTKLQRAAPLIRGAAHTAARTCRFGARCKLARTFFAHVCAAKKARVKPLVCMVL
ncbi:methyl-accepting chemotaxis sensory transducer [Gracilaria domingensis]|nr:methyl-accepting chemotaxis sensory transducer [Gracilaria domingensis]